MLTLASPAPKKKLVVQALKPFAVPVGSGESLTSSLHMYYLSIHTRSIPPRHLDLLVNNRADPHKVRLPEDQIIER